MQVSVEATGGLEKRMTVDVPAERVEPEVLKRLKSMQPTVKLPGFRPGKVPMSVVKKRFEGKIRQEVTEKAISLTFAEAVKNEDLKIAGMPKITVQSHDRETGLTYVAVFEVFPEFQLASVENIEIERKTAPIEETDIDAMIETLRKQRCKWTAVQRTVKVDDRVYADYSGRINGESFAGGDGENLAIVIGSDAMVAGFEDGLVGAEAGQAVEMDLRFPDDYKGQEVAGKDVHFSVTIKTVEEPELPAIDDVFMKAFGVEGGDLNAFRKELKKNMQRELDKVIKSKARSTVLNALLAANDFKVPENLIDSESEKLAQQMNEQVKANNGGKMSSDFAPFEASQLKEQARRRVALGFIMSKITEKNDLKASDDKVRAEIVAVAATFDKPKDVVLWYYQDKSRLKEVESVVLENEVVDWVLKHAQLTDVTTTFKKITSDSR